VLSRQAFGVSGRRRFDDVMFLQNYDITDPKPVRLISFKYRKYPVRSYNVAVSALAIGAPHKWLDNLLSHFPLPDVGSERRGVARRIPHSALLHLALARELHIELGVGVRDALALAGELLSSREGAVSRGGHLRVICDRRTLEQSVAARLRDALESAPAPRRGRPARRPRRPDARDPLG
jgi:hypothetical protein